MDPVDRSGWALVRHNNGWISREAVTAVTLRREVIGILSRRNSKNVVLQKHRAFLGGDRWVCERGFAYGFKLPVPCNKSGKRSDSCVAGRFFNLRYNDSSSADSSLQARSQINLGV